MCLVQDTSSAIPRSCPRYLTESHQFGFTYCDAATGHTTPRFINVNLSERHVGGGGATLKADIRCYAYRGRALLHAARLDQGQTTNFRTRGGGFAPVITWRSFSWREDLDP